MHDGVTSAVAHHPERASDSHPEGRVSSRPHADLRNRHYVEWLEFLRQAEGWSPEEIARYQLAQAHEIVSHAYQHAAGYRRLYDGVGFQPGDLTSLDDLRKLPLVEKEMLRDDLEAFTTRKTGAQYVTTGGSTGIPFGFHRDTRAFARELASKAHQYRRLGWREGDPQMVFRGLPINARAKMRFYPRFNELRCSSYHLTPEYMERYRQAAWRYQPQWLRCYPSTGSLLARFLLETGREFPPLQGVLCASENLYDFQKDLLRRAFGCRVFSHYGHYELAVLAGFCEHEDTYHVLPQYGYAELLDPAGRPVTTPGQVGEVVATSFLMRATPFIRYRTRDYAVFQSRGCAACGRPYEIWERLEGRLQEFVVTGARRLISMTAINMHDDIFDRVRQFQFYQDQPGVVTFNYLPKPGCSPEVLEDIRRRLLVKFGADVELRLREVAEIPLTHRGKHRFLIQKLTIDGHDV